MEVTITLILKSDKDIILKKKSQVNIFYERRQKNLQQNISKPNPIVQKKTIYHDPVEFSPRSWRWLRIHKSLWYAILTKGKTKTTWSFNRYRKSIWQNSIYVHDKNFHQRGFGGIYLNITKFIYNKPTANIIMKSWKTSC